MNRPVPPDPTSPSPRGSSRLGWPIGGGVLLVVITLLVGLQLGSLPWRFRRQMLQLQGALAGGAVGIVVGYGLGRRHRQP